MIATAKVMESALVGLKEGGISESAELFNFNEFCSLIGFEEVWAFDRKWALDQ